MSGRVVHFEIPFDDAERAQAFYRSVFGWDVRPMPEIDYTGVSTGPVTDEGMPKEQGYIGGGMFQRQPDIPTPVITIDVDDMDAALDAVRQHGGRMVGEKLPVGDMGIAAYFQDSEGNLMGLWQSA
jgi:predicted enzyme related to lactoylglutathione lyase